jgi:hypothetical protein
MESKATSPLIAHLDIRSKLAGGISASFMSRSASWLRARPSARTPAFAHVGTWLAREGKGKGADASMVAIDR